MAYIPTIGVSGFFKFVKPLNLDPTKMYEVLSLDSITNLVRKGQDVEKIVYIANGLTTDDYHSGVKENVVVVVLQTKGYDPIYVDARFLGSFPTQDVVRYYYNVVSISLGHLPEGTNLEAIADELSLVSLKAYGVSARPRISTIGDVVLISKEDHELYEKQREAQRDVVETHEAKLLRAQAKVSEQAQYIQELEAALVSLSTS